MNYFSFEGIPLLFLAWVGMWLLRPLVTLLHELGHALPAVLFSSGPVVVCVGRPKGDGLSICKCLRIEFSLRRGNEGCTEYTLECGKNWQKLLILIGGPFASILSCLISGYLLFGSQATHLWVEVALVSWFCANGLVFIRSVIPMRLRPTESFPNGPQSDGLQILHIIAGKGGDVNRRY